MRRPGVRPARCFSASVVGRKWIGGCWARSWSTSAARSTPGVYEPGSRLADANGFRKDVLAEVKGLGVPIMRYPGGNFVSGYNWLDGVGPKDKRPTVLERAWNSLETNQFGTNEFIEWCRLVGTEPLLGFNLGTGTPEQAVAYVEYCNVDKGTKWSDLRREHGYERPHNVRYWCLGNEMDGPWQMGHMTAREYGRKARDAARQIRVIDPSTASSSPAAPATPSCPRTSSGIARCSRSATTRWTASRCTTTTATRRALTGNDTRALPRDEPGHGAADPGDRAPSATTCRACKRSPKRLWLSFDEWNVWYRARGGRFANGQRKFAPQLLEEVYNLEDALLVGGFLNTLLRQSDRVRVGCLAQIVNVIAPLVTNETTVLRQSIYYPYAWALKYARGRVLDLLVESETYPIKAEGLRPDFARDDQVPFVDVAATFDPAERPALPADAESRPCRRSASWSSTGVTSTPTRVLACETLTGPT